MAISGPSISVVVVANAAPPLVARTLESVLRLTQDDFELLLIDVQPLDSRLLYDLQALPRLRVVPCSALEGTSAVLNRGLHAATGDFVCFVDAGDELGPQILTVAAKLLDSADVLIFAHENIHPLPNGESRIQPWEPARHRHNLFALPISLPLAVFIQRDWLNRVGGFNELIWDEVHWDCWKRLARAGARFAFFSEIAGRHPVDCSKGVRITEQQLLAAETNWRAGRPIFTPDPPPALPRRCQKLAFASTFFPLDPTSGAAVASWE